MVGCAAPPQMLRTFVPFQIKCNTVDSTIQLFRKYYQVIDCKRDEQVTREHGHQMKIISYSPVFSMCSHILKTKTWKLKSPKPLCHQSLYPWLFSGTDQILGHTLDSKSNVNTNSSTKQHILPRNHQDKMFSDHW